MMGKINVKIKGTSPLLMHRLNPDDLKQKTRKRGQEYDSKKDAQKAAYIDKIGKKKQLYIPAEAIYGMIMATAKQYRSRRASLRNILAGAIRIDPMKIPLGHCNYEVDVRPVVVQRQRVLRSRARLDDWAVEFSVLYNENIMTDELKASLKTVLEDGGNRIGLLDFRPQRGGWFGTFEVTEFREVAD